MLNQAERDRSLSFGKGGLRGVLSRNLFAGLRGRGHEGLPLRWIVLLQPAEGTDPAEQLIDLLLRDSLVEFWAGAVEKLLLAPIRDDRWNGCVSVGFAFFVQRTAADGDEANADCDKNHHGEEDRSEDDEGFFHTSVRPNENKMSDRWRESAWLVS